MWSGHSCPLLLTLSWSCFGILEIYIELRQNKNVRPNPQSAAFHSFCSADRKSDVPLDFRNS